MVRNHKPKSFVLRSRPVYLDQRGTPVTARLDYLIWEKEPVKFLNKDTSKKPEIMQIFGSVINTLYLGDWPHFVDRSWVSTTCMQWNVAVRRFSVGPVHYTAAVKIKE